MTDFKVGDHVIVYDLSISDGKIHGKVLSVSFNSLCVKIEKLISNSFFIIAHKKQCRRILKKNKEDCRLGISYTDMPFQKKTEEKKSFDPTKPVQTRNGKCARIISTDVDNKIFPIVALTYGIDGEEICASYMIDGKYFTHGEESDLDLINISEPKPLDVHIGGVYKAKNGEIGVCMYDDRSDEYRYKTCFSKKNYCRYLTADGKSFDPDFDLVEHLFDIQDCHEYIKNKLQEYL